MNGYTCIRALTLGGAGFAAGDHIPAGAVLPGRARTLIKQGYISPMTAGEASAPPPKAQTEAAAELQRQITQLRTGADEARAELRRVAGERDRLREQLAEAGAHTDSGRIIIPITRDGGVLEVPADPESIVTLVQNLQLTAEESAKVIETMTDETSLILIHALDSRKTVKAAAQARAAALERQTDVTPSVDKEWRGDA